MVSHAFFEGLGFLIAGGIIHAIGTRDMRLMGGLKKTMPISFALMAIMIITTSGLPPFAAFFSKGLILTSVTEISELAGLLDDPNNNPLRNNRYYFRVLCPHV